ncbi:MAG: arginase family protein [Pseudodonghicola sp.]|uniref:arginase family protein n=1 Tax=Pseudodonghicola sp. TaxID=1969463 RepID=UPI003A987A01
MIQKTPPQSPVFDLILSQGRIADRTPGAIQGAALTAAALEDRIGAARIVGEPADAATDDWSVSLPQAQTTLSGLRAAIADCLERNLVPLMVANTCSASLASLPVAAGRHPDAIVLWIDAHGDFNTPETTASGYLGGMVLAAACGLWDSGHGAGVHPDQVILIGAHDIDPAEQELLRQAGVRVIPPAEATAEAVLKAVGSAPVWIHIDWDVLEPDFVPAAYKVPDGLLPTQIKAILGALPPQQIAGVELAEFEASQSEVENRKALDIILDTVSPLLATR